MSLAQRVLPHATISSMLVVGLGLASLAACSGASQKVASGGYPPSAYQAEPSLAASQGRASEVAQDRPGLGTSWGEAVSAPISFAPFVRAAPAPWAEVLLHYNDAAGVRAHADYLASEARPLELVAGDGALSVALVDDAGRTLPGFTAADRTLVLGEDGARYRIVVKNRTSARFEIVASVDGLDVIDGNPADPNRRGYLVDPHGTLAIDGFRTSDDAVAAFRFGRVADSYAAQTSGDRNVGVVGMAIFAERGAVWDRPWERDEVRRRDTADPFPQRGYAAPPR